MRTQLRRGGFVARTTWKQRDLPKLTPKTTSELRRTTNHIEPRVQPTSLGTLFSIRVQSPQTSPSLFLPLETPTKSRDQSQLKFSLSRVKKRGEESVAMAKLAAVAILVLFSFSLASAKKPPAAHARREDIPFIRCQVCERIAQQIHGQVEKKEAQISPKKVSEYQIIEIAENVCNLKKEEVDWILQIDIVEKGDKLELVDQGTEGQCDSECKTTERACQEIMGYSDTDVAEFVYKYRPSVNRLVNYLCKDLSEACSVVPPSVPKDRIPGEPFVAKPAKDAEMEKILKSMEGMPGAPNMKMYSRDELMNKKFGNDDGDEDDDSDDEDNFPGKLGNILREKEAPKKDIKQKILQSVKDAGTAVKGHVNRASKHVSRLSKQIRSRWRGKKGSKKSKKGKSEL